MANAKRDAFLWSSLTIAIIALIVVIASTLATASADEATAATAPVAAATDGSGAAAQAAPDATTTTTAAQGATGSGLAPSIAAAERILEELEEPIYSNDFSLASDFDRIDHFVHYRDPFVVNHTVGSSDHAPTGGANCTAPEETRRQTIERPQDHVYLCFPGGDPAGGHAMAYAMDSSGYGFIGGLPDQVFEDVRQVSVDVNTTSAGSRNFIEIKVMAAEDVYVNAMPCVPDLPCNDGWDYNDIDGVGASTFGHEGTGLLIANADEPHGHLFDAFNSYADSSGIHYRPCASDAAFCFHATAHEGNTGVRERYRHVFRDNLDGTLSFGIVEANGQMSWVTAPGSFPSGPVRVVVAFHNYTGTKDGEGPGFDNNVSPSTGGFTWHWDNLNVVAGSATQVDEYFGGESADRIVTPPNCVSFSQGQRGTPHATDIAPVFRCR